LDMPKQPVKTSSAPAAIGPYSQAIRAGNTVYVSGQIPLDPESGEVIEGDFTALNNRIFDNRTAVVETAVGSMDDIVKLNIFLTDLSHFGTVNELMAERFSEPYPARAAIQVAALPKGVSVEMDAVMVLADG